MRFTLEILQNPDGTIDVRPNPRKADNSHIALLAVGIDALIGYLNDVSGGRAKELMLAFMRTKLRTELEPGEFGNPNRERKFEFEEEK